MTDWRRLSREEVQAKYGPVPNPHWTPEVEREFFAGLPAAGPSAVPMDTTREDLIRSFAVDVLRAKRLSRSYVATLGYILDLFAETDLVGGECVLSRRSPHMGTERTTRTIQGQLTKAGYLVKETRPQGHGFVGPVLVYSPLPKFRYRVASVDALEEAYRNSEGVSQKVPKLLVNIAPEDVPY